ncbi:MAG: hypothetical protein C5B52_08295 [Bacteroidetes bacterium]|nr:MAG: hypothetical protein C5B52_08295 [Bacteroidota bacterium]
MMNFLVVKWKRFARWMDFNPPYALTASEWRSFEYEFQQEAPIRFFFKHRLPKLYRPVLWKYKGIKDWIRYRTIDRYHVIETGLKPGYHEFDEKILYGSFTMLKDFVEIEVASHFHVQNRDEFPYSKKEKLPLYRRLFYRRPDLGIKHLEWEATLDDPSLPPTQQFPSQAIAAREILKLYRWWVDTRPKRDYSNNLKYDHQGFEMGSLDDDFDHTAEDFIAYHKRFDEIEENRIEWDKEDDEMLIRLVKIRQVIWT